jgi:hypothetical protein
VTIFIVAKATDCEDDSYGGDDDEDGEGCMDAWETSYPTIREAATMY